MNWLKAATKKIIKYANNSKFYSWATNISLLGAVGCALAATYHEDFYFLYLTIAIILAISSITIYFIRHLCKPKP